MPRLAVRIPISPTPAFFSNVKLAALSLASLGEPYASARVTVSVGDRADLAHVRRANRWAERFPVIWRIVPHDICDIDGPGFGPGGDRFAAAADADVVLLSDADCCLIARIDDVLDRLAGDRPRLAGLMAHYPPFTFAPERNEATWRSILEAFDLPDHPLRERYSLAPPETAGRCPPAYFNNGFVAFNAAGFDAIRRVANDYTRRLRSTLIARDCAPFFATQIALAVAAAKTGVEVLALGPEYNYPNSDEFSSLATGDLANVRVIHYLRTGEVDRHDFLCDPAAFRTFREAPLTSDVNRRFRRHVLSLPDVFYSTVDGGGPPVRAATGS